MFVHSQYDENAMVETVASLNPVTFSFVATAEFMHYKDGVYTRWDEDINNNGP